MGYCVDFKGRFETSKALPKALVATLRKLEDEETGYPGSPPDDRFNPWCVTKDGRGFEVLTDKPGDWKPWLQYTIDQFLSPLGILLSGSVEWSGEDGGDCGVITIEDGKVKARRKVATGPAWTDLPAGDREHVLDTMAEQMREDRDRREPAWLAALAALGWKQTSDRTEFDD